MWGLFNSSSATHRMNDCSSLLQFVLTEKLYWWNWYCPYGVVIFWNGSNRVLVSECSYSFWILRFYTFFIIRLIFIDTITSSQELWGLKFPLATKIIRIYSTGATERCIFQCPFKCLLAAIVFSFLDLWKISFRRFNCDINGPSCEMIHIIKGILFLLIMFLEYLK